MGLHVGVGEPYPDPGANFMRRCDGGTRNVWTYPIGPGRLGSRLLDASVEETAPERTGERLLGRSVSSRNNNTTKE